MLPVTSLSLLAVFGAGVLSFLAPCVLPLVPGYLAYLSDEGSAPPWGQPIARWRTARQALWFVLGFVLLYTLLGAAAAVFGGALSAYQSTLERVGGLLLILFGIAFSGLLPVPWLSGEHRIDVKPRRSAWWRSGLIGLAFGASWSACIGPILGAILVLTGVSSLALLQGMGVMLTFALGLGVPFLLVGLMADRSRPVLKRVRRYTPLLTYLGSATMILIGVSLVFGLFSGAS
ncbi:MAG: cytochrome c biogenesis CcdA family protein [Chloroflexota bacterium]